MSHQAEVVISPRRSITATSELTSAGCHLTRLASDLGRACQKVRLYGTFVSGLRQGIQAPLAMLPVFVIRHWSRMQQGAQHLPPHTEYWHSSLSPPALSSARYHARVTCKLYMQGWPTALRFHRCLAWYHFQASYLAKLPICLVSSLHSWSMVSIDFLPAWDYQHSMHQKMSVHYVWQWSCATLVVAGSCYVIPLWITSVHPPMMSTGYLLSEGHLLSWYSNLFIWPTTMLCSSSEAIES